jgi:hypothetical protein
MRSAKTGVRRSPAFAAMGPVFVFIIAIFVVADKSHHLVEKSLIDLDLFIAFHNFS